MPINNNDYLQTCHQIYQSIHERQKTAVAFHDQMADLYDFLGLRGFKRIHKAQHLYETCLAKKTKEYYINHHNRLLAESDSREPEVIPDDWYKYTRNDVSLTVRKQYVQSSFEAWRKWEQETLDKLCLYAKALLDIGYTADFSFVQCLVEDVSCELKKLERMILVLESVKYSEEYIAEMQDELHKKYKKAAKKLLE